jgi:hypothetical protein
MVTSPPCVPGAGEEVAHRLDQLGLLILTCPLMLVLRGAGWLRQGGCEVGGEGIVHQFISASAACCSSTRWFVVVVGDRFCAGSTGTGFLDAGEGQYVITGIPTPTKMHEAFGVVGCLDHKGNHLIWRFDGGRGKKIRRRTLGHEPERSFEDHLYRFYPDVRPTTQLGKRTDEPLHGK